MIAYADSHDTYDQVIINHKYIQSPYKYRADGLTPQRDKKTIMSANVTWTGIRRDLSHRRPTRSTLVDDAFARFRRVRFPAEVPLAALLAVTLLPNVMGDALGPSSAAGIGHADVA